MLVEEGTVFGAQFPLLRGLAVVAAALECLSDQVFEGLVRVDPDCLGLAGYHDHEIELAIGAVRWGHEDLLDGRVHRLSRQRESEVPTPTSDHCRCRRSEADYRAMPPGAHEELDRASALLMAVARDPDGDAVRAFDALLYPEVLHYVRRRNRQLAQETLRLTGTGDMGVPLVGVAELDEVAHDVTVLALQRARAAARRFNPNRGDALDWVLRAAGFAYLDVVRTRMDARRQLRVDPVEDEALEQVVDQSPAEDIADQVARRLLLDACLQQLSPDQRAAVLLCDRFGFTHAGTAEVMYGDRRQVKRVGYLLTEGRRKLAACWKAAIREGQG